MTKNELSPSYEAVKLPSWPTNVPISGGAIFGLLFFLIIFEPTISAIVSPIFVIIDEVTLLLAYALIATRAVQTGRIRRIEAAVMAWVIYCIGISLLFGVNRSTTDIVIQGLSQSKLFIFTIIATMYVSERVSARTLRYTIYLVLLGGVLNVAQPGLFQALGSIERDYGSGFAGLPTALGFQLAPNRLSRLLAALPLITAVQLGVSRRTYLAILAVALFVILASGGRLALLVFMLLVALRSVYQIRAGEQRRLAFTVFVPTVLLAIALIGYEALGLNNLDTGALTGDDAPIFRIILLIDGLTLAREYFPFGAGLATFGTPYSLDQSIYASLLSGQTFFLRRGTGMFDNNYASIFGETGLIGFMIVVCILYKLMRQVLANGHSFSQLGGLVYVLCNLGFESVLHGGITSAFFALVVGTIMRAR